MGQFATNGAAVSPLQTVDRALQVLDLFGPARPEIAVADVARELGIDRSIASRLLGALAAREYVAQDDATGRFRLGIRVLDLGSLYLQNDRLAAAALPELHALATQTGGIANLFVLHDGQAVRLAADPARPMTAVRVPAHCTAAGKVLLAALDDVGVRAVIARRGLAPRTPRSITDPEVLLRCLADVRASGYASELEETNLGRGCLAAPVRDVTGRTAGAVSFSLLASQITAERTPALVDAVREAALRVSESLGIQPLPAHRANGVGVAGGREAGVAAGATRPAGVAGSPDPEPVAV
jgi:DNA-binding IclR family transcriptional regulator